MPPHPCFFFVSDSVLLTVKAVDLDSSSNGKVTFRWGGEGSPDVREAFVLDRHTGQVALSRSVDSPDHVRQSFLFRERPENTHFSLCDQDVVQLTVVASDDAVPSVRKSATATVTIVAGRERPGPSFTKELYR